ncbi:MAG: hypothetical protein KatS3mg009_1681 [Acidimicrobiia bacterium]|nr:MAG: hypothetical protein KatS3mg009_1681 [Acidimicrobiia bacterium]
MRPMRFGCFMAPFHPTGQNPTLALERDLDLIVHLDRLGFHEVWIGEHHSGGYEIIASPEVMIAVAAERTRHIRLGSGVNSLPYHHPLLLADRFVLLDHLTRGRVMLGCGPGQLTSDAHMLGIPADLQRPRMDEALDAITALLRGETVTMQTDWFTLQDATLQLKPYSRPTLEMAVAASISPAGAKAAGRHGLGLLSVAATTRQGFDAIGTHWKTWSETAERHGHVADREKWRLVVPMHVAETKEQARQRRRVRAAAVHALLHARAAGRPGAGGDRAGDHRQHRGRRVRGDRDARRRDREAARAGGGVGRLRRHAAVGPRVGVARGDAAAATS